MSSVSTVSSSSNGSFRLQARNLFLTYPQCDAPSDFVEGALRAKLKHFEWAIIAREAHADGHAHLHAFVHLSKPCNFTSPTCLDLVCPGGTVSHGNYQGARDPAASLDYVCKDGDLRLCGTTLEAARSCFSVAGKKRNATALIMEELDAGKDITEIGTDHPEHMTFIMLHMDRLTNYHTQKTLAKARPALTFDKAQTGFPPHREDSEICQWLNRNLLKERPFSEKQLWIHGPTCHGKTTLKNKLSECLRIYSVPNEDFYDDYKDTLYDLIVFDEYGHANCKTIQWLNAFVDGSTTPLRQKGKQTVKRKNLPIIVLSNMSIREVYHKCSEPIFATVARRFHEVALTAPMEVQILTSVPAPIGNSGPTEGTDVIPIE
nr:MAG: replication associated protein [Arizlama virus]